MSNNLTRREFAKDVGLAAVGAAIPSIARAGGSKAPDRQSAMDHVVVIMFENRSFDNVLGRLYQPGEVPLFEGVIGKNLSNPIPEWAQHGAGRKLVPYGIASNMNTPTPDPGEEYPHINTDLFGIQNQQNRNVPLAKMVPPFNAPVDSATPSMDGFVTDYISAFFSTSFPACAAHPHNERRTANAFVIASTAIREYAHDGVESASSFQPLTKWHFPLPFRRSSDRNARRIRYG